MRHRSYTSRFSRSPFLTFVTSRGPANASRKRASLVSMTMMAPPNCRPNLSVLWTRLRTCRRFSSCCRPKIPLASSWEPSHKCLRHMLVMSSAIVVTTRLPSQDVRKMASAVTRSTQLSGVYLVNWVRSPIVPMPMTKLTRLSIAWRFGVRDTTGARAVESAAFLNGHMGHLMSSHDVEDVSTFDEFLKSSRAGIDGIVMHALGWERIHQGQVPVIPGPAHDVDVPGLPLGREGIGPSDLVAGLALYPNGVAGRVPHVAIDLVD